MESNPEQQAAHRVDEVARTSAYVPVLQAMLVGAAAGFSAVLLLAGINLVGTWRIELSSRYPAHLVLPGIGLVGGLLAGALVQIAPEVSGSGIPQVRAVLNHINQRLDLKSALTKLVGGVIALGCGLFMGREGPTVQVGAALAAQLTRWMPTSAARRRELIAAGAGAGLAAAFNAPLAGVTFVLEELLKEVNAFTVSISLVACFSASVVENLFGNAHAHSLIAQAGAAVPIRFIDIGFYILLGLLCAFFGAIFNSLIIAFLRGYKQSKLPVIARTALAGLITGLLVAALPAVLHDYAQARQLINSASVPPELVPLAFVAFFFLVLIAYGSGAPGGLFAPALVLGAALGYMVGYAHWQLTGDNRIDIFTQVGMGGFFAAVARVPLTATVIVFEMSGNFALIPPLMIASVIGSNTAERLSKGSLYDLLMVWSGINIHGIETDKADATIGVRQVMQDTEAMPIDATVGQAHQLLVKHALSGCPVVDGDQLVGLITSDRLDLVDGVPRSAGAPIESLMIRQPVSVAPFDDLESILFLFTRYHYQWLPVADDGRLLGKVERASVISALFSSDT